MEKITKKKKCENIKILKRHSLIRPNLDFFFQFFIINNQLDV